MLYIVTALKSEAQAFVDKYKLSKTKCENFTLFVGTKINVIICGIGINNARTATEIIIKNFKPQQDDIFLNIGICGANRDYEIGELIEIGSIIYKNDIFVINNNISNTITCTDCEIDENHYNIVDMESFGFYEATKSITNRYMYKVVSDHFEPSTVTKDKTKSLIFNAIEDVMKRVQE